MVINLWKHRGYIVRAAWSELTRRHAGTGLGWLWYLVVPLAQIATFSLIFSHIMRARLPGDLGGTAFGFTVYLCSGLLPWIGFVDIVNRGLVSLAANRDYIVKLGLPEQIFFARDALSTLTTTLISILLLLICQVLFLQRASWTWLAILPTLVMLLGAGFGLGMLVGVLYVFFRDVGQFMQIVLQVWMWLAPIAYVEDILPAAARPWLWMNPVYPFIHAAHESLVYLRWPGPGVWLYQAAVCLACVLLGYVFLRHCRPELRDSL